MTSGTLTVRGARLGRLLAAFLLPAILALLASCPNPIDDALLRLVEDDIPPELTIGEPVGNTLYGATVNVSGTLFDSAFATGDHQGRLQSLAFSVPGFATLSQLVGFDAAGGYTVTGEDLGFAYDAGTGAFSFAFSTVGLPGGPKVLAFVVTDFNGNSSERALTLLEDPSGPRVQLDIPSNLSYYGVTVNLQGIVTNSPSDPDTNDVRLQQNLNALVLLLGQPLPADVPPAPPLNALTLAALPVGLPSEVLLQRPDIRAAEQQLITANANIGAARAAFYPRITLTGSAGTASTQLSGLFRSEERRVGKECRSRGSPYH